MNSPQVFGLAHIIYLIVSTLILIGLIYFVNKKIKDEKELSLFFKILGIILLVSLILNRISVVLQSSSWRFFMPSSFCGVSSLALAIILIFFKKDNKALHSVAYVGIVGAILTLVYPDFIGQGPTIFYAMTITGLIHHTITLYIVVLMLMTNYLIPKLNKWPLMLIGLSFYMLYGLFFVEVLGYSDSMLIKKPILSDTPLYWYIMGPILLTAHLMFLIIWEHFQKLKVK